MGEMALWALASVWIHGLNFKPKVSSIRHVFGWWVEVAWDRFDPLQSMFGCNFMWVGMNLDENITYRCGWG